MRIYTVHRWTAASSPSGAGGARHLVVGQPHAAREDVVELVPEGFSWWAAILGPLWALWHRLWLFALVLIAAEFAIAVADDLIGDWSMVPGIAIALLVGFHAHDARRRALARRGAPASAIVAGRDRASALLRYADAAASGAAP